MAEVTINGRTLSYWGATLLEGSYASLMTPSEVKDWVTNDNPSANGIEYIVPDTAYVKERNVTLIFHIAGSDKDDFLARYNRFVAVLQEGLLDVYIPDLGRHYFLKYEACTSFDHFGLKMCKLAVRFLEPNPAKTA